MYGNEDVLPRNAQPVGPRVSLTAQLFRLKYSSWLARLNQYVNLHQTQLIMLNSGVRELHEREEEARLREFIEQLKSRHRTERRRIKARLRRRRLLRTFFPVLAHYRFLGQCRKVCWVHPEARLEELRQRFREDADPDHPHRAYASPFEVECRMALYFEAAYRLTYPKRVARDYASDYAGARRHLSDDQRSLVHLSDIAQSKAADYRFDLPLALVRSAEGLPKHLESLRKEMLEVHSQLLTLAKEVSFGTSIPQTFDQLKAIDEAYPEPVLPSLETEPPPQVLL